MNLEKFTERSRGFIQAAQTIAMRESHQRLAPEHILKALMDDDQGLASNLIQRAGGAPQRVVQALDGKLAKIPKVSGDAGQVYLDSATGKVLDEAETIAKKAGDSFVPVERILMALAMVNGGMAAFGEKEEVLRKVLKPSAPPSIQDRQPEPEGAPS